MLRLDYPNFGQTSITDFMIPDEAKKLDSELEKIDRILMEEKFVEPFIERFNITIGRGTVPIRPYIRLMYLKFRYQFGYETLVDEVSKNIMFKVFCRIPLEEQVPDSTTLIKLNQKYGDAVVQELNQLLIAELVKKRFIRGNRLRIDTTVIESNIHYPTDAGLMVDCVKAISRTVKKIKQTSQEAVKGFRNKTRTIRKQILSIAKVFRRRSNQTFDEVRKITGEMAQTVKELISMGEKVLRRFSLKNHNHGLYKKLNEQLELTRKIVQQAETVNAGNMHLPDRIVSIYDPMARPIIKGKLKQKAEFGYVYQIQEVENGFISDYAVYPGNPRDDSLLDDAIDRHEETFGKVPRSVTADRGYGSKDNQQKLLNRGVKKVAIPRRGKKSSTRLLEEKSRPFKRLIRWRAGIEGRISFLKRKYGLRRSLSRGLQGTTSWVSWGILAHNLDKAVQFI